jgi:hypothetical protein
VYTFSLDNRLTDGGKVVSLTRQPPFTPRKIPGTHFYYRLSKFQGHNAAGRIGQLKNPITSSGLELATFQPVA